MCIFHHKEYFKKWCSEKVYRQEGICQVFRTKGRPQDSLTCCKSMAGIQTHPHPGLVPHFVYDALQLREVTAHRRALAAHVLKHWPHWGGTEKRLPLLLGHTHWTRQLQHLIHTQSWLCLHLFVPEAQSGALFFTTVCVFSQAFRHAVYSCHTSGICGMRVKQTVVVRNESQATQCGVNPAVSSEHSMLGIFKNLSSICILILLVMCKWINNTNKMNFNTMTLISF